MDRDGIGKRLRQAREAAGFTQQELADRLKLQRSLIAQIEIGRSKRPRELEKIAKELNVSPAWLQFGTAAIDDLTADEIQAALDLHDLEPAVRDAMIAAIKAAKSD